MEEIIVEDAGTEGLPRGDSSISGAGSKQQLAVEVDWLEGHRSAAWDELWRRIFSDLLTPKEAEPH